MLVEMYWGPVGVEFSGKTPHHKQLGVACSVRGARVVEF